MCGGRRGESLNCMRGTELKAETLGETLKASQRTRTRGPCIRELCFYYFSPLSFCLALPKLWSCTSMRLYCIVADQVPKTQEKTSPLTKRTRKRAPWNLQIVDRISVIFFSFLLPLCSTCKKLHKSKVRGNRGDPLILYMNWYKSWDQPLALEAWGRQKEANSIRFTNCTTI